MFLHQPLRVLKTVFTAVLLFAPGAVPTTAQIVAQDTFAFTNVSVVPMDRERVLPNHTVVVADGEIVAVGPAAEVAVPEGAVIIDGRGKFLLPGLGEMHGHLPAAVSEAEDLLFLYLAGGATSVRGMLGHPSQLQIRERVRAGELLGPRMWLASPPLSGNSAPDAATAERLVREAKVAGYDLLKVLEGLSPEAYAAIVATANEVGLPWGGHVSESVGVRGALAVGQSTIDHLDDYVEAMQPADSPAFAATGLQRREQMAMHADAATIPELARATLDAGVAVVPTQVFREQTAGIHDPQMLLARPENRYMSEETVDTWYERISAIYNDADREAARRFAELRQILLKTMYDAGVLVLMGTDAPQFFSVPGFSLHRELPLMVDSGLTPYEVLRTGTVNVATHFSTEDKAGTIAVGKYADLLLLDNNPLEDIEAVGRNSGVMIDGRWLSPELIATRLERIAEKHAR